MPIPPFIAHLTGISDHLVAGRPPIEEIMPAFLEFARGAVFVAHNAGFDFSFVNENLDRLDYAPIPGPPVCTAKLARRVVWPDVPNVKLQTLAKYFRTRVTPIHRALDDAEACAEVLHGLLDLGGRLGILTLGDLREAITARGRPHYGKIALADALPHAPGRLPLQGPRRQDPVRRQVEGPPRPREVLLLRRHPQEDRRHARRGRRRSRGSPATASSRRSCSRPA